MLEMTVFKENIINMLLEEHYTTVLPVLKDLNLVLMDLLATEDLSLPVPPYL